LIVPANDRLFVFFSFVFFDLLIASTASLLIYSHIFVCVHVRTAKAECVETTSGDGSVGELELTPVAAAVARHLNIDLSLEARAARNRRGIAFIVHGAPVSGN